MGEIHILVLGWSILTPWSILFFPLSVFLRKNWDLPDLTPPQTILNPFLQAAILPGEGLVGSADVSVRDCQGQDTDPGSPLDPQDKLHALLSSLWTRVCVSMPGIAWSIWSLQNSPHPGGLPAHRPQQTPVPNLRNLVENSPKNKGSLEEIKGKGGEGSMKNPRGFLKRWFDDISSLVNGK